ncbi:MAG: molybdenum cofactor guanylyltransferase [Pseudomonadota bacterium]
MQSTHSSDIPTIILVGGQSRRLQLNSRYKWQLPFGDQDLLTYIINKIQKQTDTVLLNGPNTPIPALSNYALPIIGDLEKDYQGPLAALLSCLHWGYYNHQPWLATIACDTPFFPDNLLEYLFLEQQQSHALALIASSDRLHPVFGLWSSSLYPSLHKWFATEANRSLHYWSKQVATKLGFLRQHKDVDPFFNINTESDYQQALTHRGLGGLS